MLRFETKGPIRAERPVTPDLAPRFFCVWGVVNRPLLASSVRWWAMLGCGCVVVVGYRPPQADGAVMTGACIVIGMGSVGWKGQSIEVQAGKG